jgi:hypothetical protein
MGTGNELGYYVIRTWQAGKVYEKLKYWVPGVKPTRSERKMKQDLRKQVDNDRSAVRTAARLLNANFQAGDVLLGLDYTQEEVDKLVVYAESRGWLCHREGVESEMILLDGVRRAAEHALRCCIRRVKRDLEKSGVSLKYLAVTSDMDGETGEIVRVHHHLVINREAKDAFLAKWTAGGVDWETLRDQDDYTPIAVYLMNQVRRVPDEKKYMPSRNLIRPQPKDRAAKNGSELRTPKGAKLLSRGAWFPGRPQYIRYVYPLERASAFSKGGDSPPQRTRKARTFAG